MANETPKSFSFDILKEWVGAATFLVLSGIAIWFWEKTQPVVWAALLIGFVGGSLLGWLARKVKERRNTKNIRVFKEQHEIYKELVLYVKKHKPREATFIHFSAGLTSDLVMALLENGAKVTFFMHNPESEFVRKSEHLKSAMNTERDNLARLTRHYITEKNIRHKIDVRYYDVPTTIRGVKIGSEVLAIGWYAWEHLFDSSSPLSPSIKDTITEFMFEKTVDDVRYWGHNRPGLIIHKDHPSFEVLNAMFMRQVANFKAYSETNKSRSEGIKLAQEPGLTTIPSERAQ